jgi:hypothetical protein
MTMIDTKNETRHGNLCRETAPANFTRSDDGGYSYVSKQPTTPEEEALSVSP